MLLTGQPSISPVEAKSTSRRGNVRAITSCHGKLLNNDFGPCSSDGVGMKVDNHSTLEFDRR